MLRDKSLIPLSHQHQHALALCVRIDRASPIAKEDLAAWQREIAEHFRSDIGVHFSAEEQALFPAAVRFKELVGMIEDLKADHGWLRQRFAKAGEGRLSGADIAEFARRLSAHIRKEERGLFERLQALMTSEELAVLGKNLEAALKDAEGACVLPTSTTRLRPRR